MTKLRDAGHSAESESASRAGCPLAPAKRLLPDVIYPAEAYAAPPNFAIVACYFNPEAYRSKRANIDVFIRHLDRSMMEYRVIECAFGNDAFDLPQSPKIIHVRTRDVMWQKERLLNIGFRSLPPNVSKVAWLDADILFERSDWALAASLALDEYPVIQLFSDVVRLPRFADWFSGDGEAWESFAKVWRRDPGMMTSGNFFLHGHTGFGWAARRAVLSEYGLYDACISGSADHLMAHAFCSDPTSECVSEILGCNSKHFVHFESWARAVGQEVRGRLGVIEGTILHLWHGETLNRQYLRRNKELASFDFDPRADIRVNSDGCWEWATRKSALHAWARNYYVSRREDAT